jgi:hypothetical protein
MKARDISKSSGMYDFGEAACRYARPLEIDAGLGVLRDVGVSASGSA